MITPLFGGKKVSFARPRSVRPALDLIKTLLEKGIFKPVIDRKYPLEKIADAYTYVLTGQKVGNVILTME